MPAPRSCRRSPGRRRCRGTSWGKPPLSKGEETVDPALGRLKDIRGRIDVCLDVVVAGAAQALRLPASSLLGEPPFDGTLRGPRPLPLRRGRSERLREDAGQSLA